SGLQPLCFVTGPDFSRAVKTARRIRLQPLSKILPTPAVVAPAKLAPPTPAKTRDGQVHPTARSKLLRAPNFNPNHPPTATKVTSPHDQFVKTPQTRQPKASAHRSHCPTTATAAYASSFQEKPPPKTRDAQVHPTARSKLLRAPNFNPNHPRAAPKVTPQDHFGKPRPLPPSPHQLLLPLHPQSPKRHHPQ